MAGQGQRCGEGLGIGVGRDLPEGAATGVATLPVEGSAAPHIRVGVEGALVLVIREQLALVITRLAIPSTGAIAAEHLHLHPQILNLLLHIMSNFKLQILRRIWIMKVFRFCICGFAFHRFDE